MIASWDGEPLRIEQRHLRRREGATKVIGKTQHKRAVRRAPDAVEKMPRAAKSPLPVGLRHPIGRQHPEA